MLRRADLWIVALSLAFVQCSGSPGDGALGDAPSDRLAGEFERQSAIVIGAAQMVQFHPQVLVDLVDALRGHVRILLLVGREPERRAVQELLHSQGVPPAAAEYISLPVDSMWARDYGPIFRKTPEGIVALDARYAEEDGRERDDGVPALLAGWMRIPLRAVPLSLEGGNVVANGRGLVLSTTRVLEYNLRSSGLDRGELEDIFRNSFAAERWAYVQPLDGEATGHVDIFCAFTAPDVVVVARMDPDRDTENARRLDETARLLGQLEVGGHSLVVHRVDMPAADDGIFRSYTNLIIANDVVLVPIYPQDAPELDARALELYRRLFPERTVVGIDATSLVRRRGALRCVSFHIPGYVDVPEL